MAESEEELKSLLMKVKEESEKAGVKLSIHWGTLVSFNSSFLNVYAQQWDCWVIRQFYQDWEHMYTHGEFMSMYAKTNTAL